MERYLEIDCAYCGQPVGHPCKTKFGDVLKQPHVTRTDAWHRMKIAKRMTKGELIEQLNAVTDGPGDEETWHAVADDLLIKYIGDPQVAEAYGKIPRWFS